MPGSPSRLGRGESPASKWRMSVLCMNFVQMRLVRGTTTTSIKTTVLPGDLMWSIHEILRSQWLASRSLAADGNRRGST